MLILQGETLCRSMSYGYKQDDSLYDRDEAHKSAKALFRDGARALERADLDKPVKMFGLFEVDAGLAAYATMAYNIGSDYASRILGKSTYDLTKRFASPHMSANNALKTAALTTTALNVVLKSGGYFMPIIKSVREEREERSQLARRVAVVLDEEVGKHSVSALNTVAKDNTILKAHVVRLDKKHSVSKWNNLVDLVVNAGPNLALNYRQAKGMWVDQKHPNDIAAELERQKKIDSRRQKYSEVSAGGELKEMGKLFMQGGTGAITDRIKKSNIHKLNKTLRPYSALEMILTLDEQFQGNPKARSYQIPGKRGESYALEEYIARIAIHHFAEMADISTEHSEIREALHEELAQAVKPIADAMRKGDLETMELIRLIGEGKLVQKGGRVIASPEEIKELIGSQSAQGGHHYHQTPKDHYAKAAYNREEFKKALHSLDGDQQRVFACLFSNEVLEDAGVKPAQIKAWREATAAERGADKYLAAEVLGVSADDAATMKHEGGASSKEVAALEQGSRKIEKLGLDAVHDLRGSATNPHGIEQAVANVAVAKILGDKAYFGTMLSKGEQRLEAIQDHGRKTNGHETHVARQDRRNDAGIQHSVEM